MSAPTETLTAVTETVSAPLETATEVAATQVVTEALEAQPLVETAASSVDTLLAGDVAAVTASTEPVLAATTDTLGDTVGGVTYDATTSIGEPVTNPITTTTGTVGDTVGAVEDTVGGVIGGSGDGGSTGGGGGGSVTDAVTSTVDAAADTVATTTGAVTETTGAVRETADAVTQATADTVTQTTAETVGVADEAVDRATETAQGATETATGVAPPAIDAVNDTVESTALPAVVPESPAPVEPPVADGTQPIEGVVEAPADTTRTLIDSLLGGTPHPTAPESVLELADPGEPFVNAVDLAAPTSPIVDTSFADDLIATVASVGLPELQVIGTAGLVAAGAVAIARGAVSPTASIMFTNVRLLPGFVNVTIQRSGAAAIASVPRAAPHTVVDVIPRRILPATDSVVGPIRDGFDRIVNRTSDYENGDGRLLAQVGVVLGTLYLAFLTLWFWATRLRWNGGWRERH